jgi:hypothetical protein
MPFEVLETVTNENAAPTATLSYLRHIKRDNVAARARVKPKLMITVPTTLFISKKERFVLQVGTGQHKGILRICGVAKGTPGAVGKGADFKNHVKLKFGFVPKFGEEVFDGMKCPFVRVDDDTYEIKVDVDLLVSEADPKVTRIAR